MSNVIEVENLGKQYRLGQVGTGTLSHDLNRFWYKVRGKEDPFLKIGEENIQSEKGVSEFVWALRDINFELKQGDVLGIIGKNGAGKSTLLKLLSQVTSPTIGEIKIKGRIAALLEVGTGFHPELTGRENVFLNGAILGMRKSEIRNKFDQIVEFAGVEKYIDTPVKRYSSGMRVRLAFAVAAHLEPEILILDEVLAVGDVAFQRKCLGKMGEVSREGRTIIFVSHNMAAVQRLCRTGILLESGKMKYSGDIKGTIEEYFKSSFTTRSQFKIPVPANSADMDGYSYRLQIEDLKGNPLSHIAVGENWQIRICFKMNKFTEHFVIGIGISSTMDVNFRTTWSEPQDIEKGDYEVIFRDTKIIMSAGEYKILVGLTSFQRSIQYAENVAVLRIAEIDTLKDKRILRISGNGLLLNPMDVEFINTTSRN